MTLKTSPDADRTHSSAISAIGAQFFAGSNSAIYVLVATPFVRSLVETQVDASRVEGRVNLIESYIQAAFLVGWAAGGAIFGAISDRLGRKLALWLSVMTLACCTGLCAWATDWRTILLLRCMTAVGIGGQAAAGTALVTETSSISSRHWLGASLQAAATCGNFASALMLGFITSSPQAMFLLGFIPILLAIFIFNRVSETESWRVAKNKPLGGKDTPSLCALFQGHLAARTATVMGLYFCVLVIFQSSVFWMPQFLRSLPSIARESLRDQNIFVSHITSLAAVGGILGSYLSAYLSRRWGFRNALKIMIAGGFLMVLGSYGLPHSQVVLAIWLTPTQMFIQGIFGVFAAYVPLLFPTLLRSKAVGVCPNAGRIVAGMAIVLAGWEMAVSKIGLIMVILSFLYIPAFILVGLLPDTETVD